MSYFFNGIMTCGKRRIYIYGSGNNGKSEFLEVYPDKWINIPCSFLRQCLAIDSCKGGIGFLMNDNVLICDDYDNNCLLLRHTVLHLRDLVSVYNKRNEPGGQFRIVSYLNMTISKINLFMSFSKCI